MVIAGYTEMIGLLPVIENIPFVAVRIGKTATVPLTLYRLWPAENSATCFFNGVCPFVDFIPTVGRKSKHDFISML